jgi:hypothetical protein
MKTTEDKWVKLILPIDFLRLPTNEWIWCDIYRDAYRLNKSDCSGLQHKYWKVTGNLLYLVTRRGCIEHIDYKTDINGKSLRDG